MTFRQGPAVVLLFNVPSEIGSIRVSSSPFFFSFLQISEATSQHVNTGSHIQNPIIVMQTFPPRNRLRKRNTEFFQMGMLALVLLFRAVLIIQTGDKDARGMVTVKFDTDDDNWLLRYQHFISWIRKHVETKTILRRVSPKLWIP